MVETLPSPATRTSVTTSVPGGVQQPAWSAQPDRTAGFADPAPIAPHRESGRFGKAGPDPTTIFFVALLVAGSGFMSPPIALLAGVAYGFAFEHPLRREAASLAKLLLQLSVILLGFGMNLHRVLEVGRSGFLYTALSIALATACGLLLGRLFRVDGKPSFLITMGTAICGGSAIAALAPVTGANEEEISISMGTVFLLNSLALLIFPAVGGWLHLSQSQFGLWAALAIHDTSSVVGAAAKYGPQALEIGTTVKLARALWIVPVSLLAAMVTSRMGESAAAARAKVRVPWFIFLFLLASVVSTSLTRFASTYQAMNHLGKLGLTATLFLIGTGLSRKTLKQVGVRPMLQGVLLWVIVGCASLAAIFFHIISV